MITNSFIPISITNFHNYLLHKYSIDIYEIPDNDWNNIIYDGYCKNIIDNKFCLKKYKISNLNNEYSFCSKCCKKKNIKRKPIYKKRKKIKDNNEDSGFYTETDNEMESKVNETHAIELYNQHSKNVLNYSLNENIQDEKNNFDAKINIVNKFDKIYFKKDNINNHDNQYNWTTNYNDKYIQFGSLIFNLNQHKDVENKLCNKKLIKRILIKTKILTYFKKLYLKNKNYKKDELNMNIDSDIYYIFLYIIDLIFRTKNVNLIRREIYNCLGVFGVYFYRSQLNSWS